jgi:NAD(P)-dependent dehydrogenase (short-subunit alcohol dehydrogenase family)
VVAGATRGAGRGIARGLGEAGATVYCTGRSVRGQPSAYGRPETIEETAELVTAAGGVGIAVRVDHTEEAQVEALFERVRAEQGRLDVLADGVAGEDPLLGGWTSFWETDLSHATDALRQSLVSHLITAKHAARLMMPRKRGLIVEVTEGDLLLGGGNVVSDIVKTALKGLAARMSEELRKHRVTALSITPGFLRSETMLERFGVTEENWREGGKKDPNFLHSETPLLLGRAVAALAQDAKVFARTGELTSSWEVAREFDLTDADGRRPDWGVHLKEILPSMKWLKDGIERHVAWLDVIARRGESYLPQD